MEFEGRYPHIAEAFYNSPWAILPEKLTEIAGFLRAAMRGELALEAFRAANPIEAAAPGAGRVARSKGAVAVLPLYGAISQRMNLMSEFSGGTSTQAFAGWFRSAIADPDIKAILIDTDSPGGSVPGIEELAAEIYKARGTKPIVAIANSLMASAAYWIGSAADELVVTPSSQIGSIGVYTVHYDESKALEAQGVTPTIIRAGKYKAEGMSEEPLTDEAKADIESRLSTFYGMFVDAVARGRGVSSAQVRDGFGEGRVVTAKDAVRLGMADRVATYEDTLARLGPRDGVRTPGASADEITPELQARAARLTEIALMNHAGGL